MNWNRFGITAALLAITLVSVAFAVFHPLSPTKLVAEADDARIVLKAPDKAKVGELVILDVSESNATSFKWQLQQKSSNFLVIDNGRRAVFSAEAGGEYTFVVAAAKDNTVDVKIHIITIPGGPAQPTDDIGVKIADWCKPISYPQKRDDLLKLAQSFSSVSAIISDQMSPEDIVKATIQSNRDALGGNLDNWVPFLQNLQDELKARAGAGKLPDTEAHRQMWRAIADGLKDYAATL